MKKNLTVCPNTNCKGKLELIFQGENYRHYTCEECGCSVEQPIKEQSKLKQGGKTK